MLEHCKLLTVMSAVEREAVERLCTVRKVPKHFIVLTEGEHGENFYFVLEGKLRAYLSDPSGKEVALATIDPGDHFGELALIQNALRSASVISLEPCSLAVLSRVDFHQTLLRNGPVAAELLRIQVERVAALTGRIKELAMVSVRDRVAKALLSLAEDTDQGMVVEPWPTQQYLANSVGASREMVSRVLRDLRDQGCLKRQGNTMILDRTLAQSVVSD